MGGDILPQPIVVNRWVALRSTHPTVFLLLGDCFTEG